MAKSGRSSIIRINHLPYKLVFQDNPSVEMQDGKSAGIHGAINTGTLQIIISRELPPPMALIVLLHELFHGVMTHAGIDDQDEGTIDALSYGLFGLLKENPQLMDWIKRGGLYEHADADAPDAPSE